jgi:hypothetical protein
LNRNDWAMDLRKYGVLNYNAALRPDSAWAVTLTGIDAIGLAVNPDLLLAEEEALGDLRARLAEQYASASRGR